VISALQEDLARPNDLALLPPKEASARKHQTEQPHNDEWKRDAPAHIGEIESRKDPHPERDKPSPYDEQPDLARTELLDLALIPCQHDVPRK
jgi:hypothetical protein